jgi:hypothetical protein
MLLLKSSDWRLIDVVDGLLKFENIRFANEYYLSKTAKFVNREINEVAFMQAEVEATWQRYLQETKVEK